MSVLDEVRYVEVLENPTLEPCPSCGALLGGRAGCQAVFDELSARAWTSPSRGRAHTLVVDTYSMQHPADYCRSAKSYAAHLTALCCGIEHTGNQQLYWAIARWLDGPGRLDKPAVIDCRGSMTIADIRAPRDERDYDALVRRWAESVWAMLAPQQPLARQWLDSVRTYLSRGTGATNR